MVSSGSIGGVPECGGPSREPDHLSCEVQPATWPEPHRAVAHSPPKEDRNRSTKNAQRQGYHIPWPL